RPTSSIAACPAGGPLGCRRGAAGATSRRPSGSAGRAHHINLSSGSIRVLLAWHPTIIPPSPAPASALRLPAPQLDDEGLNKSPHDGGQRKDDKAVVVKSDGRGAKHQGPKYRTRQPCLRRLVHGNQPPLFFAARLPSSGGTAILAEGFRARSAPRSSCSGRSPTRPGRPLNLRTAATKPSTSSGDSKSGSDRGSRTTSGGVTAVTYA